MPLSIPATGVITARQAGSGRARLSEAVARGDLIKLYPGVYVPPSRVESPLTQAYAAQAAAPQGVLVSDLALSVWFGSPWQRGSIDMVGGRGDRRVGRLRISRVALEPAWWEERGGLRLALPAFSAAYCAATDDGHAIDDVLRRGVALPEVRAATDAMSRWRGQPRRRAVVEESRDLPWSAAERRLHRILRDGGITGWVANLRVIAGGSTFFLDVGFRAAKLYLEADGYSFHASTTAFERDRRRHNALALAGWRSLHFTWDMLQEPTVVLAAVRAALQRHSRDAAA